MANFTKLLPASITATLDTVRVTMLGEAARAKAAADTILNTAGVLAVKYAVSSSANLTAGLGADGDRAVVTGTGEIYLRTAGTWNPDGSGVMPADAPYNTVAYGYTAYGTRVLSDMEVDAEWVLTGGASFDTAYAFRGTRSIRFDSPPTRGTIPTARINFATPQDFRQFSFRAQMYQPAAQTATFADVTIRVFAGAKELIRESRGRKPLADRWTVQQFMPANGALAGVTPDGLKAVTAIELSYNYSGGTNSSIWLDMFEANQQPDMPVVSIVFDDNNTDTVTNAIPYMERYGMRAHIPTVVQFAETGVGAQGGPAFGWDTALQLQGRGHEIGNHTWTHQNHNLIVGADAYARSERELLGGYLQLIRRGVAVSGARHLTMPGGSETVNTYDVARRHFASCRHVNGDVFGLNGVDPHRLTCIYVSNTTPAATTIAKLTKLKQWGGAAILCFHRVLPDGETLLKNEDIDLTQFKAIIDALAGLQIPVVTMDEMMSGTWQRVTQGYRRDIATGNIQRLFVENGTVKTDAATGTVAATMPADPYTLWDMVPGPDPTIVLDRSGSVGRSGTLAGTVTRRAGPYRLIGASGSTNRVNLAAGVSMAGQAEFTALAVVKLTAAPSGQLDIRRDDGVSSGFRYAFYINSTGVGLRQRTAGATDYNPLHGLLPPVGAWTLVAISWSVAAGNTTAYLRGGSTAKNVFARSGLGTSAAATGEASAINALAHAAPGMEIGHISEYQYVLTEAQVDSAWAALKGQFGY